MTLFQVAVRQPECQTVQVGLALRGRLADTVLRHLRLVALFHGRVPDDNF